MALSGGEVAAAVGNAPPPAADVAYYEDIPPQQPPADVGDPPPPDHTDATNLAGVVNGGQPPEKSLPPPPKPEDFNTDKPKAVLNVGDRVAMRDRNSQKTVNAAKEDVIATDATYTVPKEPLPQPVSARPVRSNRPSPISSSRSPGLVSGGSVQFDEIPATGSYASPAEPPSYQVRSYVSDLGAPVLSGGLKPVREAAEPVTGSVDDGRYFMIRAFDVDATQGNDPSTIIIEYPDGRREIHKLKKGDSTDPLMVRLPPGAKVTAHSGTCDSKGDGKTQNKQDNFRVEIYESKDAPSKSSEAK